MIFIDNRWSTSATFNLAFEEYLFKNVEEDLIMIWRSAPSIIVGKHQNALAEINYPFVESKGLPVVRRLSGGGTVYHDLGNLNFTFMLSGERGKLVDFSKFIAPIIKALDALGVTAEQGKRNEILVDKKKISGNAEHTFRNRVLHHGTLLFDADLGALVQALRVNPLKFTDKAIRSVQSRVVNLKTYLPNLSFDDFRAHLNASLKKQFAIENEFVLTDDIRTEIEHLEREKYQTWDWNFGYSPNYKLHKLVKYKGIELEMSVEVKKGMIEAIHHQEEVDDALLELFSEIKGLRHQPEILKPLIAEVDGIALMDFF